MPEDSSWERWFVGSRVATAVFLAGLFGSLGWLLAGLARKDETATTLSFVFLLLAFSFGGLSLLSRRLGEHRNPIRFLVHAVQVLLTFALTPALALAAGLALAIAPLVLLFNLVAWVVSLLVRATDRNSPSK